MIAKLITLCAGLSLSATALQAATVTIDFEDKATGPAVRTLDIGGVTAQVTATTFVRAADGTILRWPVIVNTADAFDITDPTDGDPGLAAPLYDQFTGPAPAGTPAPGATPLNPGKVLVVNERRDADPGPDTYPDNDEVSGKIMLNFDRAVTVMGFTVMGRVSNTEVRSFSGPFNNWTPLGSTGNFTLDYDNQYRTFSGLNWVDATRLVFDFRGSPGAIDNLVFDVAPVPLPGSLPLLLAGAVGFAALRKRKRA